MKNEKGKLEDNVNINNIPLGKEALCSKTFARISALVYY